MASFPFMADFCITLSQLGLLANEEILVFW
jgi:hypothetical protein